MSKLVRFRISIDSELLRKFDKVMEGKGYTGRSKAFSDLAREELVKKEWTEGKDVAGALSMSSTGRSL